MSKPILIITYYWPPGSSPGVQRWLKFVKYLPELGWQPIILTVRNGSFPAEDPSLLEEVPAEVITYRARSWEPFAIYNWLRGKKGKQVEVGMGNIKGKSGWLARLANYIRANYFIPDARKGWNWFAAPKMKEIIQKHGIELVVTTGPPQSTHLLGLTLKSSMPGLSWMADFRDPWTSVYYNQLLNRTARANKKDQALESRVLRTADRVSVISEGMRREFEDRAKKIDVIYNGYDPEDMPEQATAPAEKFILSYIGNFKHSQNIESFWKVLARLVSDHPRGDDLRFRITGNVTPVVKQAIQLHGLSRHVEVQAFVPHREATRLMVESHVLYLPIPDIGNNRSIITGKIFEYLASRTPILAVGPVNGDAARLLASCDREPMMDYQEEAQIYDMLKQHLDHWVNSGGQKAEVTSDAHLSLTRRSQAEKLSDTLKAMTEER